MKFTSQLLILLATIALVIVWIVQIRGIQSKSYQATSQDLYKIDSIGLLNRAFKLPGGKSGNNNGYEFEDERWNKYRLTGAAYFALKNRNKLYDTLQYSSVVMTIITNKEGLENYHDESNKEPIPVLDIIIGGNSYIDLHVYNAEMLAYKKRTILLSTLIYAIFILCYFYYRKR